MIFVVDIGNSNLVAGIMDSNRKVRGLGRMTTDKQGTGEKWLSGLKTMLEEVLSDKSLSDSCFSDIEGTVISSVVPEVTDIVRACMERLTGKPVLVVNNDVRTGIELVMDNPERVGTDLIVDAVAASNEYGGKIIIFDMGTATTCSVVADKRYLGTIIIPGVAISHDALVCHASQLPKIDLKEPKKLIGTNTIESMLSGSIYGSAAMIDGLADRVERELGGGESTVVATGGIAGMIVPHCSREIIYEPDLLLRGLWYIYYQNM